MITIFNFNKWLIGCILCILILLLGFGVILQVRLDKLYIEVQEEIEIIKLEQEYMQHKTDWLMQKNQYLENKIQEMENKINN